MCSLAQSNYWSHNACSCFGEQSGARDARRQRWRRRLALSLSGCRSTPETGTTWPTWRRKVRSRSTVRDGGEDTAVRPVHFHWICHFLPLSPLPSSSSMYIPVLAIAQDSKGFSSILKYSRAAGLMMQQLNWRSPKIRWNRRWLCTESAN
jgi:hypothetical protein